MEQGAGVCEDCGYELAGLAADRCPECGAEIRGHASFVLEPWPPWWVVVARMCWPCAGASVAMAVVVKLLAQFQGALSWLAFAWPTLLVLWVTLAVAPALSSANHIALRCVLRPGRARVRRSLTALGFAINVALTWLIAGVAAAI